MCSGTGNSLSDWVLEVCVCVSVVELELSCVLRELGAGSSLGSGVLEVCVSCGTRNSLGDWCLKCASCGD